MCPLKGLVTPADLRETRGTVQENQGRNPTIGMRRGEGVRESMRGEIGGQADDMRRDLAMTALVKIRRNSITGTTS